MNSKLAVIEHELVSEKAAACKEACKNCQSYDRSDLCATLNIVLIHIGITERTFILQRLCNWKGMAEVKELVGMWKIRVRHARSRAAKCLSGKTSEGTYERQGTAREL